MMFRSISLALILVIALCCAAVAADIPKSNGDLQKPNIVLILADDLGYEAVGCDGGNYKTPNLDRLAASGVRFDRCMVQPVCTPTRVGLMTGMSNARNYIEFGTMDPKSTTFGNLLKNAGYATAIAGKWQLGRDKDLPQRFGFDEAYLWQHTRRPPRYANPGLEYNGEERDFKNGEYGPDIISDFALDFITKNKSKPFFLYYPMMLTHAPFQPTPDSADWDPKSYSDEKNKKVKYFAEDVTYMDKLVGKVIGKLDELGLRDNTLVLFLGDNGTGPGVMSKLNGVKYPGGKGKTTARGMHVPLIANWPGHTPSGKVNDDLIDSVDFLPTLCAAAGVSVPTSIKLDGRSFYPQILGERGDPREWIYTWYSSNGTKPIHEFVTSKEYKLYRDGRFFNLKKDPYEEQPPEKVEGLKGEAAAAAEKLQAALAQFNDARPAELQKLSDSLGPKNARKDAQRRAKRLAEKNGVESEE